MTRATDRRSGTPRLSRRSLLAALVVTPVAGAVFAACGDDSSETADSTAGSTPGTSPGTTVGSGVIAHPSGTDDVVIRLGYEGGLVPQGFAFVNTPTVLISGDGRVFTPAPVTLQYPGALVAPMNVRTITEDGMQRLLTLADQAGLLSTPVPDYTIESMVADAPDTVLGLAAEDSTFEHRAYALDIADAGPGSEAARDTLRSYVALLTDLPTTVGADQLGPDEPFQPTSYRFQAYPQTESDLAGYDPAPTIVDWPASTGVRLADATECATVDAAAIGDLFSTATTLTFFREDGQVWSLAVAAVLPGDPAC